jgi:hypothetical protein
MKKFLLAIFSAVITLVLLEAYFQLKPLSLNFYNADGWWKENWLKQQDQSTSERVSFAIDSYDEKLGWRLTSNLDLVDRLGNRLTSNSKGVRGKTEFTPSTDAVRVVTLGDSFTFGQCVADDETYSSYLEQIDDRLEVVNLGVHGYGSDQQLLKLQLEGTQYEPKIIIVGFVNENLERNRLKFRDFAKPKFILKDGTLKLQESHIKSPEELKRDIHLHTLNYLNILVTKVRDTFFRKSVEKYENALAMNVLEEMISTASSINAQMVLLYLPDQSEILENRINPHIVYQQLCERTDIICIDPSSRILTQAQKTDQPSQLFAACQHYAKEVYKIIATSLYEQLKGYLPNSVDEATPAAGQLGKD